MNAAPDLDLVIGRTVGEVVVRVLQIHDDSAPCLPGT